MAAQLDVVFILDPRFEGGVSTAVATELAALLPYRDLRIGLLPVKAHLLGLPFPTHPALAALVATGQICILRPGEDWQCQLALIHHPVVFEHPPQAPLPLKAERAILVLHHPMRDAEGMRQYDLDRIAACIRDVFCADLMIAPVSVVVRHSLGFVAPPGTEILSEDWHNLLDLGDWPFDPDKPPPAGDRLVIGRHARPHPQKWPDTRAEAENAYLADHAGVEMRALGGGPFLTELYGANLPANWIIREFTFDPVQPFLANLDAYVYFHSASWSEAFGRNILEALATGLVTVLPPHFEPLFGEAALYCAADDVADRLAQLRADPHAWQAQRLRARHWVLRNAASSVMLDRLKLYGLRETHEQIADTRPPPKDLPALAGRLPRPVLFVSTNGIGLGHLTQQLAIAERLPRDQLQPVFATMCLSLDIAAQRGFPVFYLPHHKHLKVAPEPWNTVLAEELFDLIRHLQPAMLAYDGTAVFGGLVQALAEFPDLPSLWVRRAMWRDCHSPFLGPADAFTAIIEPGELASDWDHGPTRALRPQIHVVPPVLHIDPDRRLPRDAARAHYGLPPDALTVALQLGSSANFDLSPLRARVLEHLLAIPEVVVLEIVSPLAARSSELAHPRLKILQEFPSFAHSRALDAAISVAGYNAFHEQLLGRVPTLFVPNEAPEMDSQLTRAQWAATHGLGLSLRAHHQIGALTAMLDRLLDPGFRHTARTRMAALSVSNGASDIAAFITDYSAMTRTDRSLSQRYPR